MSVINLKEKGGGVPVQSQFLLDSETHHDGLVDGTTSSSAYDDEGKEASGAKRGGGGQGQRHGRDGGKGRDARDAQDRRAGYTKGACIAFQKKGTCRLGDACKYKHIPMDPQVRVRL